MKDDSLFESYYTKYYNQIFVYVARKINDDVQAEDITMDAFLSCYQHFDDFNPEKASFATWIYFIANNKIKNYFRDHKIFEMIEEEDWVADNFTDELEKAEYVKNMRDVLVVAMDILSPIQQDIIIYKFYKDMNSNEIAKILGTTDGNVRVQLSRAIKKLRQYFDKNNIDWEC